MSQKIIKYIEKLGGEIGEIKKLTSRQEIYMVYYTCYVIGVLPNGLPVENGSYTFDIKIILIGLIITTMLYMLISYLSARVFEKQEV